MDSTQRKEFDGHMAGLFGAWGRNYSPGLQDGYWQGLSKMQLSDLVRVIDRSLERFGENAEMRLPTVGDLWATKRALRAVASVQRPDASSQDASADVWAIAANRHLWNYLHGRNTPKRYAPMTGGKVDREETARRTTCLTDFKNAWARDMREAAAEHTQPADGGAAWWADCMGRAEAAIDAQLKVTA